MVINIPNHTRKDCLLNLDNIHVHLVVKTNRFENWNYIDKFGRSSKNNRLHRDRVKPKSLSDSQNLTFILLLFNLIIFSFNIAAQLSVLESKLYRVYIQREHHTIHHNFVLSMFSLICTKKNLNELDLI